MYKLKAKELKMAAENKTAVPAEVIRKVTEYMTKAYKEMEPYAVTQTPKEQQHRQMLGERHFPFVEKAYNLASVNPKLVPSYLDMKDFETKFSDLHELSMLRNSVMQVLGRIEKRRKVSGCEALSMALKFYKNVQSAAEHDFPGAQEANSELKFHFNHMGRKKKTNTTENGKLGLATVSDSQEVAGL
jgi:hypothetical protein